MGFQGSELPIDSPSLIQKEATLWLQKGVQPIQDSRVAQVCVVQQNPVALLNGLGHSPIYPLKPATEQTLNSHP